MVNVIARAALCGLTALSGLATDALATKPPPGQPPPRVSVTAMKRALNMSTLRPTNSTIIKATIIPASQTKGSNAWFWKATGKWNADNVQVTRPGQDNQRAPTPAYYTAHQRGPSSQWTEVAFRVGRKSGGGLRRLAQQLLGAVKVGDAVSVLYRQSDAANATEVIIHHGRRDVTMGVINNVRTHRFRVAEGQNVATLERLSTSSQSDPDLP